MRRAMSTNRGGNYRYRASRVHRPTSLEQLRRLAAGAPRLRVPASRHSFTDIADSDELVALDALAADIHVDREAGTVACSGAVRYGDLARVLDAEGPRAAKPRLAAAHLGRRRGRDGDARLG